MRFAFPNRMHGHGHAFHVTVESALLTTGAFLATVLFVVILLFALLGSRAF
jgi:hypothetical protein